MTLDVRKLCDRLGRIESIAVLGRAASTNLLGRRVLNECIENRLPLPSAVIIAREQTEGLGRAGRSWFSPADRGIWATTLHTRDAAELPLLPLQVAVVVARFVRRTFGVETRIKWPNDLFVDDAKIGGILIEARAHEGRALVLIGTGINVFPLGEGAPPASGSIAEASERAIDIDDAIGAFVETVDRELFVPYDPPGILDAWRELSMHRDGDRVGFSFAAERIDGTWAGIDALGRARVRTGDAVREFSAGDLIMIHG
jgi:BirA family biotin operon repressor/biotin-[acetyl-CoA-carboxylase] ligase